MWKPWQAGCHWRALELGALGNGMVKERQHWIFLDSGPFASERVPLFWIQSCPSPLALFGVKQWFWVLFEVKIFFSAQLYDMQF